MSKVGLKELIVDNEVFKRIKKYKRTIYVIQNKEFELQKKEKIIIVNNKNNKKLKRKIVKVYPQDDLNSLKTTLKRKEKYLYPRKLEEKGKITAIEFKYNKKIIRKLLLGILLIILLLFIKSFINGFITDLKINKFRDNISNMEKEKISYVFIEINPSLVLTVKDNKVSDVACLNDDCIEIYKDIDVKGKSINEGIENLYNLSKEKGYDVSNGVKVKTTDKIDIKNKDYISVEYIDNTTKNELLSNVKNNKEIKNVNNDNYYINLWKELKKDEDYGKVYECNMNNEELECYIKKDFVITTYDDSEKTEDMTIIAREWAKLQVQLEKIAKVLKKFNIVVKDDGFIFNNPIAIININGVEYSSFEVYQTPEKISYDAKIKCDFYGFNLVDINLLNPNNTPIRIILDDGDIDYNLNSVVIDIFDTFDCSNKYCKKITQRDETKYICDDYYGDYMWREEIKESGEIPIIKYEVCDANKNNCRTVSKEYFNKFSLEYGSIDDLPECEKNYTENCNDMGYCYVNNSSTSYCRSRINLNSEWFAQGPTN